MPEAPMPPLRLDPVTARRFMRRAVLLDTPSPDVATALAHHGYIQIDPINVCGRMHDLILRNRVANYPEGGLMHHLHGKDKVLPPAARTAFEHHIPSTGILVAFLARQNPLAVVPVAILFGAIAAAGGVIQRRMGLPDATVLVLQGILFVVLLVSETFDGRFKIFEPKKTGDRV